MSGTTVHIDKLSKDNFETWKLQVEAILQKNNRWGYVNGSTQLPGNATDAQTIIWQKNDQKACAEIMLAINPLELCHIKHCTTSKEIWDKLEEVFRPKGPARKARLLKQLLFAKMGENDNMSEHLNKIFNSVDRLKEIGVEVAEDLLVILVLYSIPNSYENFRCAIEARDILPVPEDLKIKLIDEFEARKGWKSDAEKHKESSTLIEEQALLTALINSSVWNLKSGGICELKGLEKPRTSEETLTVDYEGDQSVDDEVEKISSGSDESEHRSEKSKTKKRRKNMDEWKTVAAKKTKNSETSGVSSKGIPTDARAMGFGCVNCRFKCQSKITVEERRKLFDELWDIKDHSRQWDYIRMSTCTKDTSKATSSDDTESSNKRPNQRQFFFLLPDRKVKVCRNMFLQTFGISKRWLATITQKQNSVDGEFIEDLRGKHKNRPNKISTTVTNSVHEHIARFNRIESHYCTNESSNSQDLNDSSKSQYLNESLNINNMYANYIEWMANRKDENVASKYRYKHIFNSEYKLFFHKPKKDQFDKLTNLKKLSD